MKLSKNIVALQKNLVLAPDHGCANKNLVATVQSHMMKLGYMLDEESYINLQKSNVDHIVLFHDEVMAYLTTILGGALNYKPFYKNFPQEVMSKTDCELFLNACIHYLSNGKWEPNTEEFERPINIEQTYFNVLKYASEDRFNRIFTDLVSLNTSILKQDMDIVMWFVNNNQSLIFPETIPFKENLCTLAGMGLDVPVKTTTDVLRIAVHMSGGDISLPKVPAKKIRTNVWSRTLSNNPDRILFKFKKFTRSERRYILSLLEKTNCDTREMSLKAQRWVRLGEILHPGEYKNKFPKAFAAINAIRNENVRSWYSELDKSFSVSLETGLNVLIQRPGEFARRIDWLVRTYPDNTELIMKHFVSIVDKISNKVLFEVYNHLEKRLNSDGNRYIMPKGSKKKFLLPELVKIPEHKINNIHSVIKNMLELKFSKLDKLGVCYIDERLKKIPLPTNMRSLDFSSKPIIRGMRIPINNSNSKVIRAFVHWLDKYGNEDLDLSATFIGKNKTEYCSYSGLKVGKSVHSGDVRHRQGACAEYIDIDIKDALNNGYKYVSLDVRNFNGGSLSSVNAIFGTMEREFPESNKLWLPDSVNRTQVLSSNSSTTIICVIDLETNEYIMIDSDIDNSVVARGDSKNTIKAIESYTCDPKFSVYDLIMLHVNSRGSELASSETDDKIDNFFNFEDFESSYEEIGKLMGI